MMFRLITAFLLLTTFSVQAQQPELRGGLSRFLSNNLIYPAYSFHHCIQGTVSVGFKLNAAGVVYYTSIVNGTGTDLDEEALRLVRMSSGKWIVPKKQDTLSLVIVPINFSLNGDNCKSKSKTEIDQAIRAYQNEQQLTNAVMNFYRNKEKGDYKPDDERDILAIKKTLDIDDEYLDHKIDMGLKKYKQGDQQGACADFLFVKYMGSDKANDWLAKYCK